MVILVSDVTDIWYHGLGSTRWGSPGGRISFYWFWCVRSRIWEARRELSGFWMQLTGRFLVINRFWNWGDFRGLLGWCWGQLMIYWKRDRLIYCRMFVRWLTRKYVPQCRESLQLLDMQFFLHLRRVQPGHISHRVFLVLFIVYYVFAFVFWIDRIQPLRNRALFIV
jgi:hypothetical protein